MTNVNTFPFCGACGWYPFGSFPNLGTIACDACGMDLILMWGGSIEAIGEDLKDAMLEPPTSVVFSRDLISASQIDAEYGGGLLDIRLPYLTNMLFGAEGAITNEDPGITNPVRVGPPFLDPDTPQGHQFQKVYDPAFIFDKPLLVVGEKQLSWKATQGGPLQMNIGISGSNTVIWDVMKGYLYRASDDAEMWTGGSGPGGDGEHVIDMSSGTTTIAPVAGDECYWGLNVAPGPSNIEDPATISKATQTFIWGDDYDALETGDWSEVFYATYDDLPE